eukprot:gb/GFBE01010329.1/.p1 GENE.gb/GFBE01010329.1/~~gb/GFBE01010329.1/.p1  ORF type:complete len:404 (+),score=72.68 gb/GFBE01010329.1/:1-1212(+)
MRPCVRRARQPLLRAVLATRGANVWAQTLRHPVLTWLLVAMSATVSEGFFILVLPIVSWCVDMQFGRNLLIVSSLGFVSGNFLKNLLELPRPVDVDTSESWHTERGYGFPSTHALSAILLPLYAMLCFPELQTGASYAAGALWMTSIVFSRVYLGVHSVPDVVGGVAMGICLAFGYHGFLEGFFNALADLEVGRDAVEAGLATTAAAVLLICLGALMLVAHPDPNPRSSTLDESAVVTGASVGALLGSMLQAGSLPVAVPASSWLHGVERVGLGLAVMIGLKVVSKQLLVLALRPLFRALPSRKSLASSKTTSQALLSTEDENSELEQTRQGAAANQRAMSNWQKARKKVQVVVAFSHPFFDDMYETDEEWKGLLLTVKYFNYMITALAMVNLDLLVFARVGV